MTFRLIIKQSQAGPINLFRSRFFRIQHVPCVNQINHYQNHSFISPSSAPFPPLRRTSCLPRCTKPSSAPTRLLTFLSSLNVYSNRSSTILNNPFTLLSLSPFLAATQSSPGGSSRPGVSIKRRRRRSEMVERTVYAVGLVVGAGRCDWEGTGFCVCVSVCSCPRSCPCCGRELIKKLIKLFLM